MTQVLQQLQTLTGEMRSIKEIITETNSKVDTLNKRVSAAEKEIENRYQELVAKTEGLKMENAQLRCQIEDMDQYSRKGNMIITGIVSCNQPNKSTKFIVEELARALKVDLKEHDIVAAH